VIEVIPPVCPDNCSGNGICVNLSTCEKLEKENKKKFGADTGLYLLSCGANANTSKSFNQTGACACYQGFIGLNCLIVGKISNIVFAALGAGLIALIVILAILGAALAGGGAAAVSNQVASPSDATVMTSPLYQSNNASGTNPIADMYDAL
jgi:hypothetical protein